MNVLRPLIDQLDATYRHVRTHSRASLYRHLYQNVSHEDILTMRVFESLPFLSKERLQQAPFWDRIFVSKERINHIQSTTGTSGAGPLLVPESSPHEWNGREKQLVANNIPVRLLHFFGPIDLYDKPINKHGPHVVVHGDFAHLKMSAWLAKHSHVNALNLFPSTLEAIIPEFQALNMTGDILSIELEGEPVALNQRRMFKRAFPNATFHTGYSLTESQGAVAQPVISLPNNYDNVSLYYKTTRHFYIELIDEHDAVIKEENKEGEIVITRLTFENVALPLVRYKTGDKGVYHTWDNDHTKRELTILGRIGFDYIHVPHGRIQTDEIERVLDMHTNDLKPEFQMHVHKTDTIRCELRVIPTHEDVDAHKIAESFATHMRINPRKTYASLVVEGMCMPLTCTFVDTLTPPPGKKFIPLVTH